ncbi:Hsp70 suppressor, GTPase facilitates ribosomal subunit dissociation [Ascosphaera pollenicola]|nr:Hsp70 suppressor, GTPase facilitates ribosomal subunit dissociation [Ascosphaera pollenicola]
MLFPPVLLFTTYLNLLDPRFKQDAAGLSATWAGLYLVLAARRSQKLKNKFSVRGAVRGAAMGVGFANLVAGGTVYMFGVRERKWDIKPEGDQV